MRDYTFNEELMYVDDEGYPRFKDTDMLVHRWVMSKKKGRRLNPEEVVHHNDGNKMNFHPSNLRLFQNQEAHEKHHEWKEHNLGGWHASGRSTYRKPYSSDKYEKPLTPFGKFLVNIFRSLIKIGIVITIIIALVVVVVIIFGVKFVIDTFHINLLQCCPALLIISSTTTIAFLKREMG